MTLRISSSASRIDLDNKHSQRTGSGSSVAALAGISLDLARKKESAPTRGVDPLRYELTSLNEQSVAAQKKITSRQGTLNRLNQLKQELAKAPQAGSDEANSELLRKLDGLVKEAPDGGRQALSKTALSSSDNPEIEPVVVSEPPQVGSYKVSILGEVSADALQFEIEIADGPDFKKSLVTALSPATGIIEGVEVYFEEKVGRQDAEIVVNGSVNGEFPIPDFDESLKRLSTLLDQPEKFSREVGALVRKVDSTIEGVQRTLDHELSQFQTIANAQENIRAAVSEPRSVSNAFSALKSLNAEISKQSSSLTKLFSSSDSVKNLLE